MPARLPMMGNLILSLACAAALSQSPSLLPTITTAHAVHSLSPEQAARAFPVHLRAVVTYFDRYIDKRHGALFIHDPSGSIFVALPLEPVLPLQSGDLIEVTGVTGPGDYAPIIAEPHIKVVGHTQLPVPAARPTMAELLAPRWDGQWAEIQGVVHEVHVNATNATLVIATAGGSISATTVVQKGVNYQALLDSVIRLYANNAPVFNRARQLVGVHLYFPPVDALKVIEAAPADPYAVPALSASNLLRYTPGVELARRARVRGVVTLDWPGRRICIQQEAAGLCMLDEQGTSVQTGSLVDVLGFPTVRDYKATLENPTLRLVDAVAPQPEPQSTVVSKAILGDTDGQLVRIEGTLIGQEHASGDLTLILRSGADLFMATLPRSAIPTGLPRWKDTSKLSLTGICSVQYSSEATNRGEGGVRPASVLVLLRSVADVQVLQSPSWWTTQHSLMVLGVAVLLIVSAFAWVVVLRRRVELATEALRQSQERLRFISEHDALTGLPNRILLHDRLNMALSRAQRFKKGLALLMVDVDYFKEVNDALGHHAGDRLLRELALRISEAVRKTDTVARIGGDEFIVLLPDLQLPSDAESIAAKILAAISAPFAIGAAPVSVTVSLGVCHYPLGGADAEALLQSVDAAMYRAKASGRNSFQVFTPTAT